LEQLSFFIFFFENKKDSAESGKKDLLKMPKPPAYRRQVRFYLFIN